MRIGIDISAVAFPQVGVSNAVKNLNENLVRIDKEDDLIFFFSSLRRNYQGDLPNVKKLPIPPTLLNILWNKLHVLPVETLLGKLDVFHSSDWTQPPSSCRKVTTIHDLTPLKFSQDLHPKIVSVHKNRLRWVAKEVDKIVCVSHSTQRDVIELLGVDEGRTAVIYNGVSEIYKPEKNDKVKKVLQKFSVKSDYILAVGNIEPRKNLSRAIEAFVKIKKDFNVKLVIVGRFVWGKGLKTSPDILILNHVSDSELVALYSGAKVFVYPSLYEGFGIPILEAMACGTPVACSSASAMPEIAGDAAEFFDPYSTVGIADTISRMLAEKDVRERCIKAGIKRSADFSWEKSAQKLSKVYHGLA